YLNNILQNQLNYSDPISTNISDLIIGENIEGSIDDIHIYNRALSESEISSLYHENGWTGDTLKISFTPINTDTIEGTNGAIDVSVSGGTKPYSFLWSNGATTEDITGLSAGVYTITVTDTFNNTATDSIRIYDTFIDGRDATTYKAVSIGDQIWMAENLKWLPEVSPSATESYTDPYYYAYDYQATDVSAAKATDNYNTYGALYNWPAAINDCPAGWHLPSDDEWKELEMFLGMSQSEADATDFRGTNEGGKLKETGISHWNSPNTGATNESGFNALPGGYRSNNGTFYSLAYNTHFWSASEYNSSYSWNRTLHYNDSEIVRVINSKDYGYSIRCLKDKIDTSLIAHYPFNGNANDESGNGNDGTVNGAALTTDRFGNENSAYSFDGIDDYIEFNTGTIFDLRSDATFLAFVKRTDNPDTEYMVFCKQLTGYQEGWFVSILSPAGNSKLNLQTYPLHHNVQGNESVIIDEWTQIVMTYNSTDEELKFYVNGKLDKTEVYPVSDLPSTSSVDFRLGGLEESGGSIIRGFKGIIDDVRIYDRALTSN
ncbi:MAG: hypothetical protein KAJ19_27450, partial [Gammaproteobacteria bacterium]|nr:hypothetical protein [Gammaproteobacteria bacterium]